MFPYSAAMAMGNLGSDALPLFVTTIELPFHHVYSRRAGVTSLRNWKTKGGDRLGLCRCPASQRHGDKAMCLGLHLFSILIRSVIILVFIAFALAAFPLLGIWRLAG